MKRLYLTGTWIIANIWLWAYLVKDVSMYKVWWGVPYFVSAIIVAAVGMWTILLFTDKEEL